MNIGILFDGHLMEGPRLTGGIFHNQRNFKELGVFRLFDSRMIVGGLEVME